MREAVLRHVGAIVRAHDDFARALPGEAFGHKLSIPSNSIGAQFWCVVGARESFTRALQNDGWVGFSCSLEGASASDKALVVEALEESARAFAQVVGSIEWTDARDGLLLDLLEHEVLHQGQLVRYAYGLGYRFPESWASRWSLAQPSG